jgi:AcrR family transcriptional regulator
MKASPAPSRPDEELFVPNAAHSSPSEAPPDSSPSPLGEGRRTGQQRLGGRSERVVREVLRATAAEIARVGYAQLRVEDVAAQAGVNKTTVYRRWPTKADLVDATLRALKGPVIQPPDLGSLRLDAIAIMRESVANALTCEGRTIHRMITLEIDHPEVASIARALRADYYAPWLTVVSRAIERGELPQGTDVLLVVEMFMGAVFGKIRLREDIDEEYLAAVINVVLVGAKGGGAIRRRPPHAEPNPPENLAALQ